MKSKLLSIIILIALNNAYAVIRYVKPTATGTGDGTTWANASGNLQTMINASSSGDEIWMTAGTYIPTDYPASCSGCATDRDRTFLLKAGVTIRGGFAGNEVSLSNRSYITGKTILSGDINNNGNNADDVHHVIMAVGINAITEVERLTILKGNANVETSISVGGQSIGRNWGGGAVMAAITYYLDFNNVIFVQNHGEYGGAAFAINTSNYVHFQSSLLTQNTSKQAGAIYSHTNTNVSMIHCTITKNHANEAGGGLYNFNNSNPTINHSIIWGNTTGIWDAQISNNGGTPSGNNNIIEGGTSWCSTCPNSNGDIDPQFVNLSEPAGLDGIYGTTDDGLLLSACSPGIDRADLIYSIPNSDVTGKHRINDLTYRTNRLNLLSNSLDLGAYERYFGRPSIYVNNTLTTGANDGSSWANAFRGEGALQSALEIGHGCEAFQILVAEGIYKPTAYPQGCSGCNSTRDYTLHIPNGVALNGGYSSTGVYNGTSKPILSGDIGTIGVSTDNVRHVLLSINTNHQTQLTNFLIQEGGDNIWSASPHSINIGDHTILSIRGGGIYTHASSLIIANCNFTNNTSYSGAVIYNNIPINLNIVNSIFNNNSSVGEGGVIMSAEGNVVVWNSIFDSNNSSFQGGAFYNLQTDLSLVNSVFIANHGNQGGGAISNFNSDLNITNCTFIQNSVGAGFSGSCLLNNSLTISPTLRNCIIWGHSNTPIAPYASSVLPTITYSDVQGGYAGTGNQNIDPQFINPGSFIGSDGLYRTADDGLALRRTSPCINTGISTSRIDDILHNFNHGLPDMGAYEFMPKNNCIRDRHISDVPIEAGTHLSSDKITANGIVESSTTVLFDANKSITLLPGFETQAGAVFRTNLDGCSIIIINH